MIVDMIHRHIYMYIYIYVDMYVCMTYDSKDNDSCIVDMTYGI